MEDPQLVLFSPKLKYPPLWREPLVIPAYIAVLSSFIIVVGIIWNSYRGVWPSSDADRPSGAPKPPEQQTNQDADFFSEIKATIRAHGVVIFALRCLRLASCLALVAITAVAFIQKEESEEAVNSLAHPFKNGMKDGKKRRRRAQALQHEEWIEVIQCAFYCYLSLLSLLTLTLRARMTRVISSHLTTLLLLIFAVYCYRDIWPLMTFTHSPLDFAGGWFTWSRVIIVSFLALLLPLITPREYVPLDRQNPNNPNGEQTASPLAFMLFTFLDITVYHAWKYPHLPYDLLPTLCDYDRSKHLRKIGFRKLLPPPGVKPPHLAFRLLSLYRKEFIFMAICMTMRTILGFLSPVAVNQLLTYIEMKGEGSIVRPWVWIVLLFFSPILSSILLQLYIFASTGALVRTEGILTQLVFEHALRIRMKEDAPKNEGTSMPNTPKAQTFDLPSADEEVRQGVDVDAASTTATTAVDGTTAAASASITGDANAQNPDKIISQQQQPTPPVPEQGKDEDSSTSGTNIAGRINNLISTDLENITDSRDFMFLIIYAPLQTALCIVFLYSVLGWSSFVGMGVLLLSVWAPVQIGKWTHSVQVKRMKATDARVQKVTEIMNVVRMVKMFGWETKMGNQLREKRDDELKLILQRFYISLVNQNLNWVLPLITMVVTFFTHTIIMGEPLSVYCLELAASTVFPALTVFDSLRDQLHFVFWAIPSLIQGKVSMDRIDDFLTNTELLDRFMEKDVAEFVAPLTDPEVIGFHNAVFTWGLSDAGSTPATPSRRKFKLRIEDDLFFKRGAFNLIVGPTGSGKTSLLLALLGELHFSPPGPTSWFNLPREKGVAYAAQEPWILNETIKQNIIFEDEFDAERYKATLHQCALDRDLELFTAGDETEVGEKGLTLSGGQKARISLARAVYSKAEILLLDDVLSALDVHTARLVVDKCFSGPLLKGRTVILVTHNVAMTNSLAENVVEVASDGTITQRAGMADVLSGNPKLFEQAAGQVEAIQKDNEVVDEPKLDNAAAAGQAPGKLIADEEIALGHVSMKSMMLYFANMGGVGFWVAFWTLLLGVELMNVLLSWWLGVWAHQYELVNGDGSQVPVPYYLGTYAVIVFIALIGFSIAFLLFTYGAVGASRKIHQKLIDSVLSTTLRFLDKTPTGRIVARFTRDVRAVDGPLADDLQAVCEITAAAFLKLAAIVYFTPVFLWPGLAFGTASYILGTIYIAAQLSVKREMSNARSPLFSHFGAAIDGLTSIRAYGAEESFKTESLERVDKYTRPARAFYNLNRWIGVRIDTLGGMFSAGLAAYLVYVSKANNASDTGLQLNLAVGFTGILIWWVRCLNELEVTGNSLERIQAYVDIDHEPQPTEKGKPPAAWPSSGDLIVQNLCAKYSEVGPEVLHNLSFSIRSGEKIGVVGRTGSGKSSLTLSLLRLIPTSGEVLFDSRPISQINLQDLRRAITTIPQQPELISGTIRQNLDPFEEHDDLTLNDALRSAGLFSLQKDLPEEERITLESTVSSGGSNFSLGQRQILALARALVRQSRVLILDEATASLDHETDSLVQQSLSTEFNDVTLITIAHRLQTIMNSDKILVLDAGKLVEFDSPAHLLRQENGAFKSLVDGSGDKEYLYTLVETGRG